MSLPQGKYKDTATSKMMVPIDNNSPEIIIALSLHLKRGEKER